ncbi:MAG: metal-sulfur cluster biosynthetic enzyme [Halobacteriales archaeon]|jgi:metal-sulfur cluster biosynthetic enzyme
MVTEDDVREALKTVQDPEIPINIVDLGLIYDVEIDDGEVHVDMTLTTMGCPIADYFLQEAKEAVESVDGVEEASVELVWEPPWSPEKATEDGKAQLQSLGISI